MKHRPHSPGHADPTRPRLLDMIDTRHELVRLAALIDWSWFEEHWAGFFPSPEGRPALHPRLGRGPDVSAARPWPLRRGRPRPLGGEPVLPALHRRGVLPAPPAHSPLLAQPLAQS